jgi:hypothetical protein
MRRRDGHQGRTENAVEWPQKGAKRQKYGTQNKIIVSISSTFRVNKPLFGDISYCEFSCLFVANFYGF